ncbi:MAG: four helix bundle protein [Deltaproteobacteria bacterium]|nr:four helix bundle protein [Deltaproteobacteria bacterium]
MLKNYKELKVWQKSYHLCLEIYKATPRVPKEERFGLTSRMRGASVSVPSNMREQALEPLNPRPLSPN